MCVLSFLVGMLSVFSMKNSLFVLSKHSSAGQLRSASTSFFHLVFAMRCSDTHTHTHLQYTHADPASPQHTSSLGLCRENLSSSTRRENILAQEETTGAGEIDFDLKVTANKGAWKRSLNLNLFPIPKCK